MTDVTDLADARATDVAQVLTDAFLDDPGWLEYCLRIRHFPRHKRTPMIMLTCPEDDADRLARSSASGEEDFLAKPFNVFEMAVKILTGILKHRLDHAALR